MTLLSILVLGLAAFGLAYYANTFGFCGLLGPTPCPSKEALNLMSSTLNSPTSLTMKITNTGSAEVSITSYYVKDTNGHLYASRNWVRTQHDAEERSLD